MNILFTNYHPRNGGGHVTYIVNLIHGLKSQHRITVATPSTSRLYRYAKAIDGVTVVDMAYPTRLNHMWGALAKFKRILADGAFDVIHVNGSSDHRYAMLATMGRQRRARIVLTKHNDHSPRTFGNWLRATFGTDHTIGVSQYIKTLLDRSPYARKSVTVVRHGIDTAYFAPPVSIDRSALRRDYIGANESEIILLGSAGGTDLNKGWLDLAAGIALLPDALRGRFRMLVAGDPPLDHRRAQLAALGLTDHVIFPGLLDDVRPMLAACDVGFVLSYQEALSFACREAMSLGLPVLITDVGGLPENVNDGQDGWIVPVRDPRAIATVLTRIAQEPQSVIAAGKAARRKAESDFTLAQFCAETLSVYEQAVASA